MAPNFLSKLVRGASPNHTRDRSLDGPSKPSSAIRSRSRSTSVNYSASNPPPLPPRPGPEVVAPKPQPVRVPSFITANIDSDDPAHDSDSTFPSVTVIPPSPLVTDTASLSPSASSSRTSLSGSIDQRARSRRSYSPLRPASPGPRPPSRHSIRPSEDNLPTPTANRPLSPKPPPLSQQATPSAPHSTSPRPKTPQDKDKEPETPRASFSPIKSPVMSSLFPGSAVRKQPSNRSLKQPPPITITHARSATVPAGHGDNQEVIFHSPTPIVESPTGSSPPGFPPPLPTSNTSPASAYLTASSTRDPDSISIVSTASQSKEKKRSGWRRPSSAAKKPTGLASAIAASSLSLANHSLTAGQQAHLSAAATATPSPSSPVTRRKHSVSSGSPPYTPSTSNMSSRHGGGHVKSKSAELSPGTSKKAIRSATSLPRSRAGTSVYSDGNSEYYGDDRPEYYSGLEESSSDSDSEGSDDDLMDLDLGEDDIPVTGFAVASNKRNADFHELFPNVPEGDYLIDDYGCALQREILIQGRLYISENHVCFHANIFGWITDLSIPINEITQLEKKMTAFVIPNGIQITTRRAKYTFASFLSRDTTFDVIYNIWKLERQEAGGLPQGIGLEVATQLLEKMPEDVTVNGVVAHGLPEHKATQCACGRAGEHYSEIAMETVVPGTPERIHNLMFASGFMKDFLAVNQKLLDIQISDWAPIESGSTLLARNMSYIKPLNGSIGPKQTKCEIRDESIHADFDDYSVMLTTTRTPEVPSGTVFSVKTRTCIMWASAVSTRIIVSTQVEWTGRSFIKGIIERSAIDGQKAYHNDLETAMRSYIAEHQTEFVPAGIDPEAALAAATREVAPLPPTTTPDAPRPSIEEERKRREYDRNRRGLQWAYETFDGAYTVAKQSTNGALELVKEAWEQSTTTTILYFVIVGLVLSNIWTLMRVGTREEMVRRKMLKREEEKERLVQGVVNAIWEELGSVKAVPGAGAGSGGPGKQAAPLLPAPGTVGWREEVSQLQSALDVIEERVRNIRSGLNNAVNGSAMDTLD